MQRKSVQTKRTARKSNTGAAKPVKTKEAWIEATPKKTESSFQEKPPATIKAPDGTVYIIPSLPDDATELLCFPF